ncbi:MAG: hypothetical protein U0Y68_18640 [Blastocatellia bacterium]
MLRAFVIVMLCCSHALLAQPATRKRQVTAPAARPAVISEITEDAVEELEKWWIANVLDYGDPTDSPEGKARREAARNKLENLYDLAFRYVNSDGTPDTRSAHLQKLRTRQLQYQQIKVGARDIRIERARANVMRSLGSKGRNALATATVTYEADLSFRLTNQKASTPISYRARITHQWVWVDRWQLLKHQTERIK